MNLIRKAGTVILTAVMCISTISAVNAQENTDEVSKEYLRKEAVLIGLGLISEETQPDVDGEAKEHFITRSEFANAIVMTVNDTMPQGEKKGDLSANDRGLIWLAENGYVNGYEVQMFKPNNFITVAEAAKIALSMMGYTTLADAEGGYPNGYLSVAQRCKLFKSVNVQSDKLDRKSFVNFLYNVIGCNIMELDTVKGAGGINTVGEYVEKEGCTLLTESRDIHRYDDIITANEISGLYSHLDRVAKNHIKIGDMIFECSDFYSTENTMLGMKVESYYQIDDLDNQILLCAVPDDNEVLTINSCDIDSYANGVYTYSVNNSKNKKAKIDNKAIILYNGAYSNSNQVFIPEDGEVTLLDNDNDSDYDVLKIRDTKLIVVEQTTDVNGSYIILDKYDKAYNETIKDYSNARYRVYDANGTEQSIDKIKAGSVIGIEKTVGNDPYYTIKMYNQSVSGKITAISDDSVMLENGNSYDGTARFKKLMQNKKLDVTLNSFYIILMDDKGRMVCFDEPDTNTDPLAFRVGYLYAYYKNDEGGEPDPLLSLLDESGVWKKYGFASSVKIDGKSIKRSNVDMQTATGDLVKYKLNIEGEIQEIITPKEIPSDPTGTDINEDFQLLFKGTGRYRYYPGGFVVGSGNRIINLDEGMKLFVLPSKSGNPGKDQISVTVRSFIPSDSTQKFNLYNSKGNPGIANYAILEASNDQEILSSSGKYPFAVNKIADVMVNGELLMAVTGLRSGTEITVHVRDERENKTIPFKKGDIVYLLSDLNEDVVTLRDDQVNAATGDSKGYSYGKLCGYDSDGILRGYSTTNKDLISGSWGKYFGNDDVSHSNRVKVGKVYDTDSSHIYVSHQDTPLDWSTTEAFKNIDWGYVYVWDKAEKKFRVGSIAEAVGAKYAGEEASDICVITDDTYQVIVIWP